MLQGNRVYKEVLFVLLISSGVYAQQSISLASYNLLNYASDPSREGYYRTIMNDIQADLLVTQEMLSQTGVNNFLNNVLNYAASEYGAGDFIDGPDTDNAIFFRTVLFDFISNIPISTSLRDINAFKVVYLPTSDTLIVYSVHLKASQGSSNEQQRLTEVNALRQVTDNLPPNSDFVICGDYNIYYSNEPAFQRLLDQSSPGYILDPIDMPGNWHNNISFAPYHTQSTRTRQFNGGSDGGLDDRFDMILVSQAVSDPGGIEFDNYYLAYGNDGLHFNDSINKMPNQAVTEDVANALHYASDHLPVICRLKFESVTRIQSQNNSPHEFELRQYPNPFNNSTIIEIAAPVAGKAEIAIYNIRGQLIELRILNLSPGTNRYQFNADGLSSGIYFCRVTTESGFVQMKKLILQK
jgi:endonuclease/exonuclease/phosphatase family metal-dependent hydrolase